MLIYKKTQYYIGLLGALLAGLAIATSTAALNIGAGLILLAFLMNPMQLGFRWSIFKEPLSIACIILILALAIGTTYTIVDQSVAWGFIVKMRMYLLVPVFLCFFRNKQHQHYFIVSFLGGVFISIMVSIVAAIMNQPIGFALMHDWAVLRTHTYHNYFAALFCIILIAGLLFHHIQGIWRYVAMILILLVSYNIFFMVNGRSTQFLYLIMLLLLCSLWRFKLGFFIGVSILIASFLVLPRISSTIQMGLDHAQHDLSSFNSGDKATSLGLRLTWYQETSKMIMDKPLLGYGTGSFPEVYQAYSNYSQGLFFTENPHNDYILFAIQIGIIGPILLLTLTLAAGWQARHLSIARRSIVYILLITMMLASLVNSFFTDNTTNAAFILILTMLLGDYKQRVHTVLTR